MAHLGSAAPGAAGELPLRLALEIVEEQTEAATVIAVHGELDFAGAARLERTLDAFIAGGHHRVVLDLTGCPFLDAAGLAAIWYGARGLQKVGGNLFVVSTRSQMPRLRRLTDGLEAELARLCDRNARAIIPIFESVPDALSHYGNAAGGGAPYPARPRPPITSRTGPSGDFR